jgi:hypothetical protein
MALLKRLIRALPLLLLSPFLMATSLLALVLTDFAANVFARKSAARGSRADGPRGYPVVRPTIPRAATVVIPNWNRKTCSKIRSEHPYGGGG